MRLVNRYGREAAREAEGDPPPQIGDPPPQKVRTKPDGREAAGEHSLRMHGTPAGKGSAGSQWAHARLGPAEVAMEQASPGVPPKSLEAAFAMGYAARRAEIELLKGGQPRAGDPPPQIGDPPPQKVRTVPDGRADAGAHSLRMHGTPAGKGSAGSQWGHARLGPAEVAVGQASPGVPPK